MTTTSTKRCRTCRESKEPAAFAKAAKYRDGLNVDCRACNRVIVAARKARREATETPAEALARIERKRVNRRAWRAANPEKVKASNDRYDLLTGIPAWLKEAEELKPLVAFDANRRESFKSLPVVDAMKLDNDTFSRKIKLAWFERQMRRDRIELAGKSILQARLDWLCDRVASASPEDIEAAFERRDTEGKEIVLPPAMKTWLTRYMREWKAREKARTDEARLELTRILAELLRDVPEAYWLAVTEHGHNNAARVADRRRERPLMLDEADFE